MKTDKIVWIVIISIVAILFVKATAWSQTPANDNFSDASTLTGSSGQVTGSNVNASAESGEPEHINDTCYRSVWWRWTAPRTDYFTLDTRGTSFDTLLVIYTGSAVDSLTEITGNNDESDTRDSSRVTFQAQINEPYYIVVDSPSYDSGDIVLNWKIADRPVNDDFANASLLDGLSGEVTGSNREAVRETGEPDHAGGDKRGKSSVWWKWKAPQSDYFFFFTHGSSFDTLLAVYTGETVEHLTEVWSNDDNIAEYSALTFQAQKDVWYHIAVDGEEEYSGDIALKWRIADRPENDDFGNAFPLSGSSGQAIASNKEASKEDGEPNHAGDRGGTSLWWTWTAPRDGYFTFDNDGSFLYTLLAVYTGSEVDNLTEIGGSNSGLTFHAQSDVRYAIAVDGDEGDAASRLVLNWAEAASPSADNLEDAFFISGSVGQVSGSNAEATKEEADEPDHAGETGGKSVWWRWIAPQTGNFFFDTHGSSFNTLLAVYTIPDPYGGRLDVDDLAEQAANDNDGTPGNTSSLILQVQAGEHYFIAVDGYNGDSGDILLKWKMRPPNDDLSNASELTGASGHITASSLNATKEAGEPDHAGDTGGCSLWWTWVAPENDIYTFDTHDTSYDTLLAVYTGSTLEGLSEVESNDDDESDNQTSRLSFQAQAGEAYHIVVDGKQGEAGDIVLNWIFSGTTHIYKFERMWPTLPQPWYISSVGVATDSKDFVYVADADNYRIQKFTSEGQFVTRWGRKGNEDDEFISLIIGITVDEEGFVYVTGLNHRVQKFTSDGQFVTTWGGYGSGEGQFGAPHGIASDARGFIYVSDTGNDRIQKFTSDGQFLKEWGREGSGDVEFSRPTGITVDEDGFVYVADRDNERIQKFTSEGDLIAIWPKTYGDFVHPRSIVADKNGSVYVLEWDRIQKFETGGIFDTRWGSYGDGNGEFSEPYGIAADSKGFVYVAERGNDRIQKFTSDGQFVGKWGSRSGENGSFYKPRGITTDSDGFIYVADTENHRIQKFRPDGQFETAWGNYGEGDGQFDAPYDIAADTSGFVYVADCYNHRVQKFTSDGQFVGKWGIGGYYDGAFSSPRGIAMDSNGFVYVADHRIQKFTSEGEFKASWESSGYDLYDIEADTNGFIYVTDRSENCVHKFTSDGEFVGKWGSQGGEDGEFDGPLGIVSDARGFVYVADDGNDRIQKFTSDGKFITAFGEAGFGPGQFKGPVGLAISGNDRLYVSDLTSHRVQVFRSVSVSLNNKAIIVSGGATDDRLWDEIQVNANTAYRSLLYQGFSSETIQFLSSNFNLEEVDGDATLSNLQDAITNWAKDADNLVIYLVDHGGEGTFRMNDTEILNADDLNIQLNQLQETMTGKVIIVYDACHAGSFLPALTPTDKDRIVITSTQAEESAYFTNQGFNSFSNYFWTRIFKGDPVKDAFEGTEASISNFQTPLIDSNKDGVANEPNNDLDPLWNLYIGNGTQLYGDAPIITDFSDDQVINDTSSALMYAEVSDNDPISRVWVVIKPPNTQALSGKTVLELPGMDLKLVSGNRYEGTYNGFTQKGTYHIALYASDIKGNTSTPEIITVSVGEPVKDRAVLVVAASPWDEIWSAAKNNVKLAYDALYLQGYRDGEDFYFMSPDGFLSELDVFGPSLSNLKFALETWTAENRTRDLVVYLTGNSRDGKLRINETETLEPVDLNNWLNTLQENISGKVTVVFDALASGNYLPFLTPNEEKERIVITGTSGRETSFLFNSDVSFSNFFWRGIMNGMNINDAFREARNSVEFLSREQTPLLNDNGNEIGNEMSDGYLAMNSVLGMGIQLVSADPVVGDIFPEQILQGETFATIWIEDVTSTTGIEKIWGVIAHPEQSAGQIVELPMSPVMEGSRYEGTYNGFSDFGYYEIAIYARDEAGNVSHLKDTRIYQASGPDMYEDDDLFSHANVIVINDTKPQLHNFYDTDDEDWIKFFGLKDESYKIMASQLGENASVVIEVYDTDGETLLESRPDELLDWMCPKRGIYYVKIRNVGMFGEDTEYHLEVQTTIGDLPGKIEGIVTNAISGEPLRNVQIETNKKGSALSDEKGEYALDQHPSGEFTLTAELEGYEPFKYGDTLGELYAGKLAVEGIETVNILMVPEAASISSIEDKSIGEDMPTSISFTLGGANMPDFELFGESLNPDLVSDTNITFEGDGIDRTITIQPNANVSGETTITVTAKDTDGTILVQTQFIFTVNEENDRPTLDPISDLPTDTNAGQQTIPLSGIGTGAPDETQTLAITAESNNTAVVPNPQVIYTSPDATGTLHLTPSTAGEVLITVTVDDGAEEHHTITRQFTVTVAESSEDMPPVVAHLIPDVLVDEDAGNTSIDLNNVFTDPDNDDQSIVKSVQLDTNPGLVTAIISGNTLTLDYQINQHGTAEITVLATSNGKTVTDTFNVKVNPVDDPPTLDPIADLSIDEDAGTQAIPLNGIGTGAANESQTLKVTASSGSPEVIPNPEITYVSPNPTGSLNIFPLSDANGEVTITVTVDDGGGGDHTIVKEFTVSVNPIDDPPTINAVDALIVNKAVGLKDIALSGIGPGAPNEEQNLTITAESDNANVVPNPDISYTTPSDTGILSVTPVSEGTATVTVKVNDGELESHIQFIVTVTDELPKVGNPIADQVVDEDAENTIILLNDVFTDPDDDASIIKSVDSNSEPSFVTATIVEDILTLDYQDNQHGEAVIRILALSGGKTATDEFTVTVNSVNDPPVVTDIPDQKISAGTEFTEISLDNYVSDVESSDEEIIWSASETTTLEVTINDNRTATVSVPEEWIGTEIVTFTATDPDGATGEDSVGFEVVDRPVAKDDHYCVKKGETLTVSSDVSLLSNDSDTDTDSLKAVLVEDSSYGMLTLNDDGSFTYTHDSNECADDSFTYKAVKAISENDAAESDEAVVHVSVIIPGDIDNSKAVDLGDAILSLKLLTGTNTNDDNISLCADVNEDGRIGAEEAIYILGFIGN